MKPLLAILILVAGLIPAIAQLTVTVSPPKVVGQKAVVPLGLRNRLAEKIESARAVVLLLDEQARWSDKPRWISGGNQDKPALQRERQTPVTSSSPAPGHSRP